MACGTAGVRTTLAPRTVQNRPLCVSFLLPCTRHSTAALCPAPPSGPSPAAVGNRAWTSSYVTCRSHSASQHVTGSVVGAAAGTLAAGVALAQGIAAVASPAGAALMAAGVVGGAVMGDLLLGAADETDMETDRDVEHGMERAAAQVVESIRLAKASGTFHAHAHHGASPAAAASEAPPLRASQQAHLGSAAGGALLGSGAALAAMGRGVEAMGTPMGAAGVAAGAVAGAVAGDLLLGWADDEDVETDHDVEQHMEEAADRVVENIRRAKANGTLVMRKQQRAQQQQEQPGGEQ